jgi:hypothetical protein
VNPQDAEAPFERMSLGVAVIPVKLQRFVANFEANFGGKSPAVGDGLEPAGLYADSGRPKTGLGAGGMIS